MNSCLLQRLTLLVALLFSLACCASTAKDPVASAPAAEAVKPSLALRVAFTAATKGNYEPCPT